MTARTHGRNSYGPEGTQIAVPISCQLWPVAGDSTAWTVHESRIAEVV
jgi:hypothetical protein